MRTAPCSLSIFPLFQTLLANALSSLLLLGVSLLACLKVRIERCLLALGCCSHGLSVPFLVLRLSDVELFILVGAKLLAQLHTISALRRLLRVTLLCLLQAVKKVDGGSVPRWVWRAQRGRRERWRAWQGDCAGHGQTKSLSHGAAKKKEQGTAFSGASGSARLE
jgi:hypothetical protein